jgi:RNA polymerase sigma-70 factor (ECF subfamily)
VQELDDGLVRRLYAAANADAWGLSTSAFRDALVASLQKAFTERAPEPREAERYVRGLHLADLALACACIAGNDAAWEHLVREHRPALYRAADAMDPTGRARELADALYADLFGTTEQDGRRRSLFRYFHGRSSLITWLRSVLAQRHVDALRSARRFSPLPDEEAVPAAAAPSSSDPERERYQALVQRALDAAIAQLGARDRLRLSCYYAQQLTLAEIGRLLHEHEATVSRHLAKTRRAIRQMTERWLASEAGLDPAELHNCLLVVLEDPGRLDLGRTLASTDDGKIGDVDRSKREAP